MPNRMKMISSIVVKFGLGFLLIGLMLFFSAGTISYWNAWVFIAALAVPMALFGLYLLIKEPETLQRRLKSKEPDSSQRANIILSGCMFICCFVLAGIDFRFGWSKMPAAITIFAVAAMLLGYCFFMAVILQNSYASRTVEVLEEQKIITGGLYSFVRHPMYTATLFIFLSMPLVLGSYYALIPMVLYPIVIVRRIKNEEELLLVQLEGYKEYTEKVRYRLLPFIW